MDKQEVIAELRRVAGLLQTPHLSQRQFSQNSRVSVSTIKNNFGTWGQAVETAGLTPIPQGGLPDSKKKSLSDEELLHEIIRLTRELGKKLTEREMASKGRFSPRPYIQRWGTFGKACQVAYAKYGFPAITKTIDTEATDSVEQSADRIAPSSAPIIVSQTYKPPESQRRKKVQFGEPIDFRGLRFAPINEQGVVYVFGMISRELGFLIESLRTEYPDCEGKRCVDSKKQRWEHVLIEFEYKSSSFDHPVEGCDLIVCWIHDWEDCPIEVLELRSQIKYLPNRSNSV